jgi:putative transposase
VPEARSYVTHVTPVVSKAVVIAIGVTAAGHREILGFSVGDSEDESFWRAFLTSLRRRGLSGVRLVISDQHAGLVAALRRCLQGAAHQRCRVHFVRNLLSRIPKANQEMVAAMFRTVFAQPSTEEVSAQCDKVADMLKDRFEKAAELMREAKEELIAFSHFPKAHWRQIWSANPLSQQGVEAQMPCRRHLSQRGLRHPRCRFGPPRHPRRVAGNRQALLLRRLHGVSHRFARQ